MLSTYFLTECYTQTAHSLLTGNIQNFKYINAFRIYTFTLRGFSGVFSTLKGCRLTTQGRSTHILTLIPLKPGRPGVPGKPRAP